MNNINWQTRLDEQLSQTVGKPKLLLHCCCGVCAGYVLEYLKEYFTVTAFYYNPNIMPQDEYELRFRELKRLTDYMDVDLVQGDYDNHVFLECIRGYENTGEGGERCEKCIRLRIKKTAETATSIGADYFTATLTVSPHKNANVINNVGMESESKAKWLCSDFKKKDGFRKTLEIAAKLNLYRQNYCGCTATAFTF